MPAAAQVPLADVMDRNAGSIDKLSDVMGALKLNFQEFFEGALSKIAPEATTIADALGDIDFVGIGEGVGSTRQHRPQTWRSFRLHRPCHQLGERNVEQGILRQRQHRGRRPRSQVSRIRQACCR
ncbi:MAG: hypothetical protein WDN28_12840 [Chthoniobacter sp.]